MRWWWLLAKLRMSRAAVCGMSRGRGLYDDFHDYPDATEDRRFPMHFVEHECGRCGKLFCI